MRECAHLVPHLHQNGAIRFFDGGAKSLDTLPNGWLRGVDLNHRPLGYEPNELPGCSTPQIHLTQPFPESQGLLTRWNPWRADRFCVWRSALGFPGQFPVSVF